MPGEHTPPPQWTTGGISELVSYLNNHATDPAQTDRLLGELALALPVWRTAVTHYAEHFGCYSDALLNRYDGDGDPAKLDLSAALCREASEAPGIDGLVRARLRLQQIKIDIAVARRSGGPEAMARQLSAHCLQLREELDLLAAPTVLEDLARNSSSWAETAIADDQWAAAADAYELAARAVDLLFRRVEVEDRLRVLATFRTIPADAASALMHANRRQDAIIVLENARQRYTRFRRGLTDLDRLLRVKHPQLFQRFMSEMGQWATASGDWLSQRDPAALAAAQQHASDLWERVVVTLREVQKLPGLERYLMSAGFNEIKRAAADFPVLYLWTSRRDTAAALLLGDGTTLYGRIDGLGSEPLGLALRDWVDGLQLTVPTTGRQRKIELATLGEVLKPYVPTLLQQILTTRYTEDPHGDGWRWGPVTLVVSGLLSYFPVHAWSPYIADEGTGQQLYHMPLMYAPSARQALAARRPPRPSAASGRLLSIADPRPLADGLAPLPLARVEAELIARTARQPLLLQGEQATPQAFTEQAARHEVLHLACHGSAGTGAPGSAWLALGGGLLSLEEILTGLVLDDTALVLLSACRSGQPDRAVPEESLDPGSVFLAAGARAVVAAMWPVDELVATLFSWRLFQLWDWGRGLPLPAAVHASRLWLRGLTVADLTAIGRAEPALAPAAERYTRLLDPAMKRFDEPYYWAAFAYTGG